MAAPVTVPQETVWLIATPVALFAGAVSTGAAGAATIVVKLDAVDHALVPAAFFAFTRQ